MNAQEQDTRLRLRRRQAALSSSLVVTTRFATSGRPGTNQRKRTVAPAAPTIWAITNPGASPGRIPANVSDAARASVTAGFANEVDYVNQ